MPTVSLFTLCAEPRVGVARAGKLEGNSRSCRNCRQQPQAAMLELLWLTQPYGSHRAHTGLFSYSFHMFTERKWPVTQRAIMPCLCSAGSAGLLHNHVLTRRGESEGLWAESPTSQPGSHSFPTIPCSLSSPSRPLLVGFHFSPALTHSPNHLAHFTPTDQLKALLAAGSDEPTAKSLFMISHAL